MNKAKRRVIAYITGRLISGARSGGVYDYAAAARTRLYGDVSLDFIQVYDEDRFAYVIGGLTPAGLSIFDYYTRQHLRLTVSGADFYGYDLESAAVFSGIVSGRSVTLFDFETSQNYRYSLQ